MNGGWPIRRVSATPSGAHDAESGSIGLRLAPDTNCGSVPSVTGQFSASLTRQWAKTILESPYCLPLLRLETRYPAFPPKSSLFPRSAADKKAYMWHTATHSGRVSRVIEWSGQYG
jgi:hypothetical protein